MIGNRFSRRGFLKTSALLGTGSLFGVPLFSGSARAQAQKLTVRMDNDIVILDPGYMVGGTEIEAQNALLPCLVNLDVKEGVYGWKPSVYVEKFEQRDAAHYDFTLKPGFIWSNGFGELTAEDVKYSYERIKTTDWKGNFEALDHVELKDKYSGTLILSQPYAPFAIAALTSGGSAILCKAAMLKVGGKFTTEFPAVCGPYLLEWTPKQRLAFRPNPDWTGPKPAFAEVDALIISEPSAAELAYEAGEVDATLITAATHARYKETLPENSAIQIAGSLQYMWLGMNTENPKLADIRVRKAIQHAVDATQVVQGAYAGITEKSNGIICPGLLGHRTATKYTYDPEKAKALLAEAGVSGLELELKTLNQQERILASQIIQAQLQAVGITVKVLPQELGSILGDGRPVEGRWLQDPGYLADAFRHQSRSAGSDAVVHQRPGRRLELGALEERRI